jgi:hypothetical protein
MEAVPQHLEAVYAGESRTSTAATLSGPHINTLLERGSSLISVTDDGRVNIEIDESNAGLSSCIMPAIQALSQSASYDDGRVPRNTCTTAEVVDHILPAPRLNIVIQIVGSRGDVQPFVALGKVLKNGYGHRVRIATHLVFKSFVEEQDLEFFNIGGDPAELMVFMVENPGLLPTLHSVRAGELGRRRKTIYEILKGCWRSCIEPGDGTTPTKAAYYTEPEKRSFGQAPFIAEVIIANPPSFAHVHCAERLGIPLHLMFTYV